MSLRNPFQGQRQPEPLDMPLMAPPIVDEVDDAIKYLKTSKTPGVDEISAKLIKSGGMSVRKVMHTLIKNIWN